jgi:hypothetical protein
MKNLAGLAVIAAGLLIAVVGARGTQAAVFPGLFTTAKPGAANTKSTTSTTSTASSSTGLFS